MLRGNLEPIGTIIGHAIRKKKRRTPLLLRGLEKVVIDGRAYGSSVTTMTMITRLHGDRMACLANRERDRSWIRSCTTEPRNQRRRREIERGRADSDRHESHFLSFVKRSRVERRRRRSGLLEIYRITKFLLGYVGAINIDCTSKQRVFLDFYV